MLMDACTRDVSIEGTAPMVRRCMYRGRGHLWSSRSIYQTVTKEHVSASTTLDPNRMARSQVENDS